MLPFGRPVMLSTSPGDPSTPRRTLRFGRYEVPCDDHGEPIELGRGGMGVTYKALDSKLDRTVVLKVISARLHDSATMRQKFLREARLLARLSHPNIAAVHDIGEEGGNDFYVMEFIDGRDLGEVVHENGPVTVGRALEFTRQAARALATAWRHGLIHRDIKPANLMLGKGDHGGEQIKLIDFGLAKAVGAAAEDFTRITQTGETGGYSPAFASPEQIEGCELDTRSDIYSLGITLWYLLAGSPPFTGTSRRQVERGHLHDPPPVELLKDRVPPPVIELLQDMLGKEIDDRQENPEILEAEIAELLRSPDVTRVYDTLAFTETVSAPTSEVRRTRGTRGTRRTRGTTPDATPAAAPRPEEMTIAGSLLPKIPRWLWIVGALLVGVLVTFIVLRVVRMQKQGDPSSLAATPIPSAPPDAAPPSNQPADFENGLGMKFVRVPGTTVLFSVWETRVHDFKAFMDANKGYDAGPGWEDPYFPQTPDHPVVFVSWEDAAKFCEWLTQKERAEGKIQPGQTYRLPTDAEWSQAAGLPREKGDSPEERDLKIKDTYPWKGGKWPPAAAGRVGNYAAALKVPSTEGGFTKPVGSFDANPFGIYDLGGNAWEWVDDWYEPAASRTSKRSCAGRAGWTPRRASCSAPPGSRRRPTTASTPSASASCSPARMGSEASLTVIFLAGAGPARVGVGFPGAAASNRIP